MWYVARKLYWTECGLSPRVMSMNLDGSEVVPLVTSSVRCPSSLRLDVPRRVLYWVDPELGVISSMMLDSRRRRVCSICDCIKPCDFKSRAFCTLLRIGKFWFYVIETSVRCGTFSVQGCISISVHLLLIHAVNSQQTLTVK